jgi:hypothetical protein
MSEKNEHESPEAAKWQNIFDNVWLLFLLSLAISTVVYNVWGIMNLLSVPPAP